MRVVVACLLGLAGYLPLRLRWFGDELRIIKAVGPGAEMLQGARLVSLAGLPTADLLARLEGYSSAENEYWLKERSAERLLEKRMLEVLSGATWEDGVPIVALPDGDTAQVELKLAYVTPEQQSALDRQDTPYFEYRYLSHIGAIHFVFRRFFDDRVRSRLGEERAARLGLESAGDFPEFLRRMFRTAHSENADFVIVDLRQNTGGNSILGFQFLKYIDTHGKKIEDYFYQAKLSWALTYEYRMNPWQRVKAKVLGAWPEGTGELTEPESLRQAEAVDDTSSVFYVPPVDDELKFKGKLIVLISNRTFSSAMEFATVLADSKLAVLVGEPTGGKPESFGDVLLRQLPRSGFRVGISWRMFRRPDRSRKDEASLSPDFEVVTTYRDYENGVDPVMEFVEQLILRERSL
ncbi:MAG: hypothetical protein JSV86_01025 [Gemmatimonadota bacterium]|nr:MAG: hypothetical protein JSV86_01025 [Gemmatimonadota bacterium]